MIAAMMLHAKSRNYELGRPRRSGSSSGSTASCSWPSWSRACSRAPSRSFRIRLDMLGDALAYGLSLYVVRRSARWKARSAIIKGAIMAVFGLAALGQAAYKAWVPHPPSFEAMGLMGLAALAANASCLGLLWRHRSDDINMHSVWICSRNDIVANRLGSHRCRMCVVLAIRLARYHYRGGVGGVHPAFGVSGSFAGPLRAAPRRASTRIVMAKRGTPAPMHQHPPQVQSRAEGNKMKRAGP